MRIASVAKAFSGAVALRLVRDGRLGLDDTSPATARPARGVGRRDRAPAAGPHQRRARLHQVRRVREAVPDRAEAYVSPAKIISWVARDKLVFRPGARYEYSNTDNIVVGLIAETVTGRATARSCATSCSGRSGLRADLVPALDAAAPALHPRLRDRARQEARGRQHPCSAPRAPGPRAPSCPRPGTCPPSCAGTCPGACSAPRRGASSAASWPAAGPARPGPGQLRRPGPVPLPHPLRHRLRAHRQLPRLRAVGRGQLGRPARGHHVAEHPGAGGGAAQAAARSAGRRRLRAAAALTDPSRLTPQAAPDRPQVDARPGCARRVGTCPSAPTPPSP